jgi:integrase
MANKRGNGEGNIQWRQRERRWRGELALDGRRRYFYGETRAEILERFDKARKLHQMGLPVDAGKEPLSKFLNRWLEDSVKPRSRPRTYALYKQQVDAHIIPALGEVLLEKLTPQLVQQKLIAAKLAEGLAPRTVGHIRAVLRSALGQAEKWLLVPRNVVKLTDPPRKRKREIKVFTPADAKKFIQASQGHRLEALFVAMLGSGLRLGEALGLRWENVDLDRKTILVREAIQRVTLADGSSELQLVEPKSDTSYRIVSIPSSLLPILGRHRANQNRERLVAGSRWQQKGFAFTSTIGTALDERNVRRDFYALLKTAKLPRIRLHDLRHDSARCRRTPEGRAGAAWALIGAAHARHLLAPTTGSSVEGTRGGETGWNFGWVESRPESRPESRKCGEPKFHELEPDSRMSETTQWPPRCRVIRSPGSIQVGCCSGSSSADA